MCYKMCFIFFYKFEINNIINDMNIEMDFIVCHRILQNQEKLKKNKKVINNTQKPIKKENEEEKISKRLTCLKCGQDQLWCYCMYY